MGPALHSSARTGSGTPGLIVLGALLLVDAAVVCWLLPLLRGWTPRVRREMTTRPDGLFD